MAAKHACSPHLQTEPALSCRHSHAKESAPWQGQALGAHVRQPLQGCHGAPQAPAPAVGLQVFLQGLHAAQRALAAQLLQPHPVHILRAARRCGSAGAARCPRCAATLQYTARREQRARGAPLAQVNSMSPLHAASTAAPPGRSAQAPQRRSQQRLSSSRPPQLSPSRTPSHPRRACCARQHPAAPLSSLPPDAAGAPAKAHREFERLALGHNSRRTHHIAREATSQYRKKGSL